MSESTNAKLKFKWGLDSSYWTRLDAGQEIELNGFVDFINAKDDRKMWPVLLDQEPSRLTIEIPQDREMLQVKLGKKVNHGFVFSQDSEERWLDSTFTCSWPGLIRNDSGRIYVSETQNMGGFWMTPNRNNDLKARISLGSCRPDENDKKTAECDLKLVKEI